MTTKYYWLLALSLLVTLSACEDVIDVDLEQGPTLLSVYGVLDDQPGADTVRITQTLPYFANRPNPAVEGAQVTLTDDAGTTEMLEEVASGVYVIQTIGQVGRRYRLSVQTQEHTYVAETQINPVLPLDSVDVRFLEEGDGEGFDEVDSAGYYVFYNGPEQEGSEDFYRFRVYVDGKLSNESDANELFFSVFSDENADGLYLEDFRINTNPLPSGSQVAVQLLSLTEDYYRFLNELTTQVNNGGLFASPPANVRTNLINQDEQGPAAVGYFAGVSVTQQQVQIP